MGTFSLSLSPEQVCIREGQALDEQVQEGKLFDHLLSSGGKTITRSGGKTITTRSSADPFSSAVAFRLRNESPPGSFFKPLGDEALTQVNINLPQRSLTAIDEFVGGVCQGNDDLPCSRF